MAGYRACRSTVGISTHLLSKAGAIEGSRRTVSTHDLQDLVQGKALPVNGQGRRAFTYIDSSHNALGLSLLRQLIGRSR